MQLNHYLNFQGQAEQAFIFYQSVFGGEFAMISRYGDMPPTEGVMLSEADKCLILHVSLP
ncbi:MAG: VOC family protein, partial [Acinetobacter sp.]